jgi:hypothetical protein
LLASPRRLGGFGFESLDEVKDALESEAKALAERVITAGEVGEPGESDSLRTFSSTL